MKRCVSILVVIVAITPSLAFASWWNPSSWKMFKKTSNKEIRIVATSTVPKQEIQEGILTDTTIKETILCNGQYWNKCPTGQLLVCPTDGTTEAYCSAPKTPSTTKPVVTPKIKNVKPTPVVTTPTPTTKVPITYTLPNGVVMNESGNIISPPTVISTTEPATQQTETRTSGEDAIIGINYYILKKTCIGLNGNQYSSCVEYAFSPEVQKQQAQSSQYQAEGETINYALGAKQKKLNDINLQIANLNAKYLIDIETTKKNCTGCTTGGLAPLLNAIDTKYNTDYNKLKVEYQQVLYSN